MTIKRKQTAKKISWCA